MALTLIANLSWVPIGDKQALLCPLAQLSQCLSILPKAILQQLPRDEAQFKEELGLRSAMVLPLVDSRVAGLILINEVETPRLQFANIDGMSYQLELKDQELLTLWHELGHLENVSLQGTVLPQALTGYQHEWLADLYLIWRVAEEKGSYTLAWQQYHRRNLAALTSVQSISHWTSPMMGQVLLQYSVGQVARFADYQAFLAAVYPKLIQLSPGQLNEYASLMQRTFGASVLQPLPNYLSWRKRSLGDYLKPTLVQLMGDEESSKWLIQQGMQ